jgi:hypothetical protein
VDGTDPTDGLPTGARTGICAAFNVSGSRRGFVGRADVEWAGHDAHAMALLGRLKPGLLVESAEDRNNNTDASPSRNMR